MLPPVAKKVNGVVITSSPVPTPAASNAACKVPVPELNAIAYLAPTLSANAFSNLLSAEANNAKIIAGYGKCLLKLDRNEEVKELLEGLEEDMLNDKNIISLIALSKLEKNNKTAGMPEEYIEEVNINPNNHELRFKLAEAYLASNLRQEGIEQLLIIVKKDRKWEDDKARKKIIELLDAFGEDDPITSETRLKLSSIIFS